LRTDVNKSENGFDLIVIDNQTTAKMEDGGGGENVTSWL